MVQSLKELNEFIRKNDLRKKFWSATKIQFKCSKCGKISTISVMQFKRKFASADVLCNFCRKATFDKSKYHYHHWTEEEKKKAEEVRKQTCLRKYGVEYIAQTSQIIDAVHNAAKCRTDEERKKSSEKRKQTCLKKYNVKSPIQNNEIRKKIEKTNLEKYGTSNPAASDPIKEKIKNTFIEKYGMNPLSTLEIREKICDIMTKRYGVKYASQCERFSKIVKDKLLKYGEATFLKHCEDNNLKPINFTYKGTYDDKPIYYRCRCLKCGNEIEIAPHNKNFKCPICYEINRISSYEEKEILKFVKEIYKGRIEENYRRLISPLEVDIYIPEKNLAIEFDGNYWHNELSKDKNYHKNKSINCEKQGVHLIHIFEYEWQKNKEKIKNILKSFLKNDKERVFARKCNVKIVSSQEAKEFTDLNHLQGHASAQVYLGLFHNNELVELETFRKPRFSKNYEWEIVRECSKTNVSVVGGKSKLFSYFLKKYNPKSIISYCDASKFTGESYIKCGMTEKEWTSPGYIWNKSTKTLSRYQCQKHKLIKLNPELANMTEIEIMHSLGYQRIYDCGQKVFTWVA